MSKKAINKAPTFTSTKKEGMVKIISLIINERPTMCIIHKDFIGFRALSSASIMGNLFGEKFF